MEETLKLVASEELEGKYARKFTFRFDSRQAGYGDRTGQVLAQVITSHEAVIIVEGAEVVSAIMDNVWDMLMQSMLTGIEDVIWQLTSYTDQTDTHQALEGVEVTLILNSTDKQLGGSTGCNQYGAPYEINGTNLTITDNIIQTLIACAGNVMKQESTYLQGLKVAETYVLNGDKLTITGGGWTLEFIKKQ